MKIGRRRHGRRQPREGRQQHRQRALGDAERQAAVCRVEPGRHAVGTASPSNRPRSRSIATEAQVRMRFDWPVGCRDGRDGGVVGLGRFVTGTGAAPPGRRRGAAAAAAVRQNRRADAPARRRHRQSRPCGGRKGRLGVPYITNMAMRIIGPDGQSLAPQPAGRRGGGAPLPPPRRSARHAAPRAARRRRGRRRRRPRRHQVRAVGAVPALGGGRLRLQLEKRIQVRSGRVLPAAGRSPHDGDAVPGRDHPAAGAEAHHHDLRGRHAYLARDLHGRARASQGRRR